MIRMVTKDYSLSKKAGWSEYEAKTWLLVPKLFNSSLISCVIYLVSGSFAYYIYKSGGIEATIKSYF